ncbi:MAG: methylated-DNA--[protein]-cysteine S-methyltransferase [Lachnospiraceae bacterium]|nr:methylated-DNA--[protein]-cysteine S-methyltransferase [Lachnospiraceae bacterium]MDY5742308.1 methylated-DNA--[protein]-cysteine S-methyltransferase [Lachnospiraceae bacterium]
MKDSSIKQQLKYYDITSPLGTLRLSRDTVGLCQLTYLHRQAPVFSDAEDELLLETERQLAEYFHGRRRNFSIPLHFLSGTVFQQQVWTALADIPYGKVCSYADLAAKVGRPKACRAVGQANHYNPISIILPCHRVIGSNGSLTGYGGGLELKRYLLRLETGRAQD